jgi:hypothetical protein
MQVEGAPAPRHRRQIASKGPVRVAILGGAARSELGGCLDPCDGDLPIAAALPTRFRREEFCLSWRRVRVSPDREETSVM